MNYNQELKEKKEKTEKVLEIFENNKEWLSEINQLIREALNDKIEAIDNELKNEGNIIDEK